MIYRVHNTIQSSTFKNKTFYNAYLYQLNFFIYINMYVNIYIYIYYFNSNLTVYFINHHNIVQTNCYCNQ